MWIARRAEWWAHRRLTKSSEDIWDIRESVVHVYLHGSFVDDLWYSEPLKNYPKPLSDGLEAAGPTVE